MVRGIENFKEWFRGYEDQYVIIGGTACDLLMTEEGLDFRATKDIDLVLIIEAVNAAFGDRFWEYIIAAGYEHRNKNTGKPQLYRFTKPQSKEYPAMIELFTRKPDSRQRRGWICRTENRRASKLTAGIYGNTGTMYFA